MKYFVVDAFADSIFTGNPAGVCLTETALDAHTMQAIAAENNLSETAFVTPGKTAYQLKWFTPTSEVDLCGHATLATAFVISQYVDSQAQTMHFDTLSGVLSVTKKGPLYEMDFPARKPMRKSVTPLMEAALGVPVSEAHLSRDWVLLVKNEETVEKLAPDMALLQKLPDSMGVIVTARGKTVDFVSRFFAPNVGIAEDPVTGSTHASLIPFWSERLGKETMVARQLSKRGGILYCKADGERVKIAGKAVLYLEGCIHMPQQD